MLSKIRRGIMLALLACMQSFSIQTLGACGASQQACFAHHQSDGLTSACAHQKIQHCSD